MASEKHRMEVVGMSYWRGLDRYVFFLEMLDVLNEQLMAKGDEPVAFDHDCRENLRNVFLYLLTGKLTDQTEEFWHLDTHAALMFKDGDDIEPFRAKGFPGN